MTVAEVARLYGQGFSAAEIGVRLHQPAHRVRTLLAVARVPMRPRGIQPGFVRDPSARERHAAILRAYDDNCPIQQMAARFHISHQRIYQIVSRAGRKGRRPPVREDWSELLRLYADNMPIQELTTRFGLTHQRIYHLAAQHGRKRPLCVPQNTSP